MGRKLDILLRRTSRQISKLKSLLSLTLSRIAVLRNHRRIRCNQARGDVAQILQLGQLDRALLRAEQVIKEQNMMDAFVMIESYCNVIIERASLLEHDKECPEELREAVAGIIFAASRCGDLPELQNIRGIFTTKFGRDFTSACTELRNNCGVNPKIIQKMSTRPPNFEIKQKVVKEIANEKGIELQFGEPSYEIAEDKPSLRNSKKQEHQVKNLPMDNTPDWLEIEGDENFSKKAHNQYLNAETAARAAFESAAFAAAAAKAAVELSRVESQGKGSATKKSTATQRTSDVVESKQAALDGFAGSKVLKKIHHAEDGNLESEEESDRETSIEDDELLDRSSFMKEIEPERSSSSRLDSIKLPSDKSFKSQTEPVLGAQEVSFDESDEEIESFAVDKRDRFAVSSKDLNFRGKDEQLDSPLHEDSSNKHHMSYLQLQPPYRKESKLIQEDSEKKRFESKTKDGSEKSEYETRSQTPKGYLNTADMESPSKWNVGAKATSMRTRRGF